MLKSLSCKRYIIVDYDKYRFLLETAFKQFQSGDLISSKNNCDKVITDYPNNPDALNLLVLISRSNKKIGKAEERARIALESNPDNANLLNSLGLVLMDQRRFTDAKEALCRALEFKPEKVEMISNLGVAYYELGEFDNAELMLIKALKINSHYLKAIVAYINLATAKLDFKLAKKYIEIGKIINENDTDLINSMAVYLLCLGELEKSYKLFNKVVRLSSEYPDAVVNRGLLKLLQGNIEDGWDDYSMRRKRKWKRSVGKHDKIENWTGQALNNKKILIWCEQGLGEVILSLSLLQNIIKISSDIVFECDTRLKSLIQKSFPNLTVISSHKKDKVCQEDFDYQSSSFELIKHFFYIIQNQKKTYKFLHADDYQVKNIRNKYKSLYGDLPLVGISWASPLADKFYNKEIALNLWDDLIALEGINIVNLQYGSPRNELDKFSNDKKYNLISDSDITPDANLDIFASQILALDLVITISNTTAHLSGGLGQHTWVLLPPVGPSSMWYWFNKQKHSPWYPSVSLFRRNAGGDKEFMYRIYKNLISWLSDNRYN